MKVLQRQTILFTLLVMFSFSCFLYLQLAYPNGKNVSVEENIYVETENIFASNMAGGDQIDKVIKSTETVFLSGGHVSASNRLSVLNADLVMRLIK